MESRRRAKRNLRVLSSNWLRRIEIFDSLAKSGKIRRMKFPRILSATIFLLSALCVSAQTRWNITDDGGIVWNVKPDDAHSDNIEMTGLKVSVIVTYAVTNGALS